MQCWQNLPEQFLTRLAAIIPAENHQSVLESFCTAKPVSIRINTLKTNKKTLTDSLQQSGITFENVPWCESALIITSHTTLQLTELPEYKEGHFYIQNLSSMVPVLVLDPQKDEKVLDIAAAPGSKTTQIGQTMQNTGEIVANDISRQRLFKMTSILNQQGVTNVKITQIPGEHIWKKYPNYFDKVLVDAPCTMEGRFQAQKADTYKDWSPKKIKVLSYLQKRILQSAFYATKPGGVIVYSTCTISPEENEEIINWLVEAEKEHVSIEHIRINDISQSVPVMHWKNLTMHESVRNTLRILPSKMMEGFFTAKIRRIL